jgi:hypothetical protein
MYRFMTSALEEDGRSAPRRGRFTPGKDPLPIVHKAGIEVRFLYTLHLLLYKASSLALGATQLGIQRVMGSFNLQEQ